MGYDLSNTNNDEVEFRWTVTYWWRLLALAEDNGWVPKGTTKPKKWGANEDWEGKYIYNEGQIVEKEDALELAKALEKAIPKLPEKRNQELLSTYSKLNGTKEAIEVPIKEFFAGDGRDSIKEFIDFCREGSFEIW